MDRVVDVFPIVFDAVTVVEALNGELGVPLIIQVDEFKFNPEGKFCDEQETVDPLPSRITGLIVIFKPTVP